MGLKEELRDIRDKIAKLQADKFILEQTCTHNIIKFHDSAICDICNYDFGWWCPDSPTHYCEYKDFSEYCKYCGEPSERK